MLGLKSK